MLTSKKNKLLAVVCCLCLLVTSVQAQISFQGYTIYDYLVSAAHPNGCTDAYVVGPPDDSIWVNFNDGQVATGDFCLPWRDAPGNDLLLETGYHRSNYTVRLKLSNGQYSAPHSVVTTDWTQLPDVPWLFIHITCFESDFPSGRYLLPLDFAADFGLAPTDVVTGIEITFLTTSGGADFAGVYIIANPGSSIQNTGTDTTICQGETLTLDVTKAGATYLWQDNSTNATLNVTQQGTYWARVTTACGTTTDTFHVTVNPLPSVDLGNDVTLCPGTTLPLNVAQPNATYLWQNNSTNATFTVTQQGTYWVRVTNQCGSVTDTINVTYASAPTANLGSDVTLCPGATLPLSVSQPDATYLWQDNSTNAAFTVTQQGAYWVQVTNQCGTVSDTINISYASNPTVNLGSDVTLCPGATLPLNVSQPNATYLWQNNSTSATFTVTQQGTYWVQVTNQCGSVRDTIHVAYASLPTADLGSDTTLCPGATLPLNVSQTGATCLWQDNSTNATFAVTQAGTYWVEVTTQCGVAVDSVNVAYAAFPTADLGNDTVLCSGASLLLDVSQPDATYLWRNNSAAAAYTVTQQGAHWVQVTNLCGSVADTINVTYTSAPTVNLGDDTTLCDGEALTLEVFFADADYLWQDNSTGMAFTVSQSGTYWVLGSNQCGSVTDSIAVNYKPLPTVNLGRDTTICTAGRLRLDATFPDATYLWQDNSTNATFDVTQPGIYWVQVNSCGIATDSLIVLPDEICGCPVFLPNAFSPNGDGVHDEFKPSCDCEMTDYHFVIFNRWGEKMFETRDMNAAWDGIYKGKRVPTEVYVYFVEYNFGTMPQIEKGNVTVVR